jgi:ATP synthase protein I
MDDGRGAGSMGNLLTVGMILVACIVIGYLVGSLLDRKLGTGPWMTVGGVLLGSAAGFVQLFRTVSRNLK